MHRGVVPYHYDVIGEALNEENARKHACFHVFVLNMKAHVGCLFSAYINSHYIIMVKGLLRGSQRVLYVC